eukprot:tig00021795_g23528.t1
MRWGVVLVLGAAAAGLAVAKKQPLARPIDRLVALQPPPPSNIDEDAASLPAPTRTAEERSALTQRPTEEFDSPTSEGEDGSAWGSDDERMYGTPQTGPPKPTALGLPAELWFKILEGLDARSAVRVRLVSRQLSELFAPPEGSLSGLAPRDWAALFGAVEAVPGPVWEAKAADMLNEIYESDENDEGLGRLAVELRQAPSRQARPRFLNAFLASVYGRCKPWFAFACLQHVDPGLPSEARFGAWLLAVYQELLVRRQLDLRTPRVELAIDPRLWWGASFVSKARRGRLALTDPLWWDWPACPEAIVEQSVRALELCRDEYAAASPPLPVWVVIRSRCEATPPEEFVAPLVRALKARAFPVLVE